MILLENLQDDCHTVFLTFRNMDNLIQSDTFKLAFDASSHDERERLRRAILNGNRDYVNDFMDRWLEKATPFEQMGMRRLRVIGQHLKIKDYHRLGKITLIERIKHAVQETKNRAAAFALQSKSKENPGSKSKVYFRSEQRAVLVNEGNGTHTRGV